MKKVVDYIRVSIDKQVQEGEGLEIQKDRIAQFCKKNNYVSVKSFADEGVSGAKETSDRPAIVEMLEYCKSHPEIAYLIVDRIDRLSRNFYQLMYIEDELRKLKVKVLYAKDEALNGEGAIIRFLRTIMAAVAELERTLIVERLSDGMRKKAKNGNKPSGLQVFGYEYSRDKKSTIINEPQAKVIRDMFQMRLQGYTLQKIADILNERKTSVDKNAYTGNHVDKVWCNSVVDRNLKNIAYIGKVKWEGEILEGNHEPIIDMDTWNAINSKIKIAV